MNTIFISARLVQQRLWLIFLEFTVGNCLQWCECNCRILHVIVLIKL